MGHLRFGLSGVRTAGRSRSGHCIPHTALIPPGQELLGPGPAGHRAARLRVALCQYAETVNNSNAPTRFTVAIGCCVYGISEFHQVSKGPPRDKFAGQQVLGGLSLFPWSMVMQPDSRSSGQVRAQLAAPPAE